MPSTSKSQQQAAAIALQVKKGNRPKSDLWGASKQMAKMSQEELEKFAKTKHKGLPKRKHKKKVNEAWGQKLEIYLDIIWRWFERQGYSDHEIDAILNDPQNMDAIQSAEAHGINPVLVAQDLKTTEIEAISEGIMSGETKFEKIHDIFFGTYLAENGFFVNKFTNLPEFDLSQSDAKEKIIQDFSKYMEEEYYQDWDPADEATIYKQIAEEFLSRYTNESVHEKYAPVTLDEFLNESYKD